MEYIGIAGIGSRRLNPQEQEVCRKLGNLAVSLGFELHSGNAEGADGAFQAGGNEIDPSKVHLHLPWGGYNEWQIEKRNKVHLNSELPKAEFAKYEDFAAKHHPVWEKLSRGAKSLHTRNGLIIMPRPNQPVRLVLAFPHSKADQGGTGQGMRMAKSLSIELIDLCEGREAWSRAWKRLKELSKAA